MNRFHKNEENVENDVELIRHENITCRNDGYIDSCIKIAYYDDYQLRHSRTWMNTSFESFRILKLLN